MIGDPVRHSLSPAIHNAAFAALGLDWRFLAFPVVGGRGGDALNAMRVLGIDGYSVTMPHKAAVAANVDRLMPAAEALGSVNCVRREGSLLLGDSTDGIGFVRSLEAELQRSIADATIGVIGAGGAARSIVDALARAGAARIVIVNRSPERAAQAASLADVAEVGDQGALVDLDIIVNTTSVGMAGGPAPGSSPVDSSLIRPGHVVADIVYQPRVTALLSEAAVRGATTVGGVGMLVHQAAVAFEWWTGEPAPLAAMADAAN